MIGRALLASSVAVTLLVAGCSGDGPGTPRVSTSAPPEQVEIAPGWVTQTDPSVVGEIRIAHAFGASYGPIIAARELDAVTRKYPNITTEWFEIASTTDQRDAMLAGTIDMGSCSPLPFLTAWDAGVDWKVLTPVAATDVYYVARPGGPRSVDELVGTDGGIGPAPGGAQDYIVRKHLRDSGKDPDALERNWVNLPHPDAIAALGTGQLAVHAATAEYALEQVRAGNEVVLKASDVLDGLYGSCASVLSDWAADNPALARAYHDTLREAVAWAEDDPHAYAATLSEASGGRTPVADLEALVTEQITVPTDENLDVERFADLLTGLGVIDRTYSGPEDFYLYPEEASQTW